MHWLNPCFAETLFLQRYPFANTLIKSKIIFDQFGDIIFKLKNFCWLVSLSGILVIGFGYYDYAILQNNNKLFLVASILSPDSLVNNKKSKANNWFSLTK